MGISTQAIVSGTAILDYIPQRAPMVMVDSFYGIDGAVSVSGLTITADNLFCVNGEFSDCGIIEHQAQSAALRVGYACKTQGREVPVGFIGSVAKLKIHALPKINDRLMTEITIEQEIFNITLIRALTRVGELTIADCQMKIYIP